jgi:titin
LYSNLASAVASTPTTPAAPSGLQATAAGQNAIDLTWVDNSSNENLFKIERAPDNGGVAGTYVQITTVVANSTSYRDAGLNPGTRYWYRVRASSSATLNSGYTGQASATTQGALTAPSAPTSLQANAVSPSRIDLLWVDASNNEDGFRVERAPDNGGVPGTFAEIGTVGAGVTTYSNNGLNDATTYWYRVRAYNAAGASSYSNQSSAATPAIPVAPTAPSGLTAQAVSSSQVDLNWADNSSNEDGFLVERAPDVSGAPGAFNQIAAVGANVTSYNDAGLSSATGYWYRVRANNLVGPSAYSNQANATTNDVPPAAPSGLNALRFSTSQINLTWTDNATNEAGFLIERADDASGAPGTFAQIASVGAGVASYSDTGLTDDTRYWYRVRAFNGVGNSAYSNQDDATTAPFPPAAPSGLQAQATGPTNVLLTWVNNATNATIITIQRAPDNGGVPGTWDQVSELGPNATSWNDGGVQGGVRYWYQIRAGNTGGQSPFSPLADVTTPSPFPTTPSGLTATATSGTTIDLAWSDNSNNEDGFQIIRALGGGSFVQIASVGPGVTSYTDSGLASNSQYAYRVRAFNAAGNSAYSDFAFAATPNVAPAAPGTLQATATSSTVIGLSWADNSNNEDNFLIERAPDAGGVPGTFVEIASVGAGVTAYNNTGLAPDTRYWYRVRAANEVGNSAYSNQASATTLDVAPATPSGLVAQAISSSRIDLTWNDNASNETDYQLERAPDVSGTPGTFAPIATLGANATSYSNTGLNGSTRYWYRVRATNGVGPSAYSNQTSATTPASPVPPAAPSGLTAQAISSTRIDLAWADNSGNEDGFLIERAPNVSGAPGTFTQIASVGANVTSYSNTGLTANTRYWYRVRANNTNGNSAYSNQANTTTFTGGTVPLTPTNFETSIVNSTTIDLNWADDATNETGYLLERAPDVNGAPGAFTLLVTLPANVQWYSDEHLPRGTYWYRVRAYNGAGYSGYSNIASGRLQ